MFLFSIPFFSNQEAHPVFSAKGTQFIFLGNGRMLVALASQSHQVQV
jgi:hypothetical protein